MTAPELVVLVTGRPPQQTRPTVSSSVLARAVALVGAALLLASLVLPWRPATLCLLRGLTGVPCPVCGSTTALVGLGRGDLGAALAASPLVVLGAPVWVLWPRLAPVLRRWRAALGPRSAPVTVVGIALLSELWQLHRAFG